MILFNLSELSMEPTWITLQGTHPKLLPIVFLLLKSRHCCSFFTSLLLQYRRPATKAQQEYCLFMAALKLSEQPSLHTFLFLIDPNASPGWSNGKLIIHWSDLLPLFTPWHPNFLFPTDQIFKVGREGSYDPIVSSLLACVGSVWRGGGSWNTSAQEKRKVSPSSFLLHKPFVCYRIQYVRLYLPFKHLPCTLSSVEAPNGCN